MSVAKRANASGGASWDVRWRESRRGSRASGRSFKTKREAHGVVGEIRRLRRDIEIVAPLAADPIEQREQAPPASETAHVCAPRAGSPLNPNNWRNRVFNQAAEAAGVGWATPYTGRHACISLQIHAGPSPVIAAIAGNSPVVTWKSYARKFDRSRTTKSVPLEAARRAARSVVARSGATTGQRGHARQAALEPRQTRTTERQHARCRSTTFSPSFQYLTLTRPTRGTSGYSAAPPTTCQWKVGSSNGE